MSNSRYAWTRVADPVVEAPLPPLTPYTRCECGTCTECRTNAKWDAIFAKFEGGQDHWPTKGMFQSTLRGW